MTTILILTFMGLSVAFQRDNTREIDALREEVSQLRNHINSIDGEGTADFDEDFNEFIAMCDESWEEDNEDDPYGLFTDLPYRDGQEDDDEDDLLIRI